MLNFDYYNPVRIIFGKDRLDAVNQYVPKDARVLITHGGGSARRTGLLDRVKAALRDRTVFEFGGIEPNPRYETLIKAMDVVRNEKINYLLAVGGGSVIDGTKFIAIGSDYNGDPGELLKLGIGSLSEEVISRIGNVLPYGVVLTLPASGSEMNNGACISYKGGKPLVYSEKIYSQFSILDPAITATLPERQVANGVVDTFVHITENYLTYPVEARIQDRMAEGVLQTLIEIGKTTVFDPTDYEARANLVWGATVALNGFVNSGVPMDGTTHMIGLELTVLYGIDHGTTTGILWPAVMDVCREQKKEKLLQFAERVWQICDGTHEEKIDLAICKTREFFESLGMNTHLSAYGVNAEHIPEILRKLEEHGMTAMSEQHNVDLEMSRKILEKAL